MQIEIRELIIKATVTAAGNIERAGSSSGAGNDNNPNEELINLCVEKILEILKDKNER